MNIIAKKISQARKIRGLTQEDLANQAEVNLRTIQRIENSQSTPRGKTLRLICEVLDMDTKELLLSDEDAQRLRIGNKIVNALFLLILNLVLMAIIGFLTLDSRANINSIFGGFLLSFFIPFFIVVWTQNMSGLERMFKFGLGYIAYFIVVMVLHGFILGWASGLFACLLLSVAVLYFGNRLFTLQK